VGKGTKSSAKKGAEERKEREKIQFRCFKPTRKEKRGPSTEKGKSKKLASLRGQVERQRWHPENT